MVESMLQLLEFETANLTEQTTGRILSANRHIQDKDFEQDKRLGL